MKKVGVLLLLCLMLAGCGGENQELERVMTFRAQLLAGMGCSFEAVITADYQDSIYTFGVSCRSDENGGLTFTVTQPDTISGISGRLDAQGGKLTFDQEVLAFEMLADGQVTPVSAPWLLVKTLRGGYVTSCGTEGDLLRASIDDSYQEDALRLDVWFDSEDKPIQVDILYADRRILSMEVKSFEIL